MTHEQVAKEPVATSRFRHQYRSLNISESALISEIKDKAVELEELFEKVKPGRYRSLAFTALEESIMWAVKEITGVL